MQPAGPSSNTLLALRRLEERLRQANAKSKVNSRDAAVAALEAFVEFISFLPELDRQYLATPVWPLLMALKDLDKGRVAPMLKPRAGIRHRAEESWTRRLIKLFAGVSIDALCKAGMNLEGACRFVTKILERTSFPIGNRLENPAWKTVKGWRERTGKLPKDTESRRLLDQIRAQVPWQELRSVAQAKPYVSKTLTDLMRGLGQAALE